MRKCKEPEELGALRLRVMQLLQPPTTEKNIPLDTYKVTVLKAINARLSKMQHDMAQTLAARHSGKKPYADECDVVVSSEVKNWY